ncbi:hypothetical protein MMC17_004424 [Xylographa soralifera]|nr:hypothetical protein [Xylographa soralifera]
MLLAIPIEPKEQTATTLPRVLSDVNIIELSGTSNSQNPQVGNVRGQVLAAQQTQQLVGQILDITNQQHANTAAEFIIHNMTDEEITNAKAQTGTLANTQATQAVGGGSRLAHKWHDTEADISRNPRDNFPQAWLQIADNDDTGNPPQSIIHRSCGEITCAIIFLMVVAAALELSNVFIGGSDLGYVARPPSKKREDPEDERNDKEIVE